MGVTTMKKAMIGLLTVLLVLVGATAASAYVFPSTNEQNMLNGDPYVTNVSQGIGNVTLMFVNTHNFPVCFEYRTDGDTSQALNGSNYNPAIPDLYPYTCLYTAGNETMTFNASNYVEVRSVFGAERDYDFNWTRFDVLQPPTKAEVLLANGVPGKGIEHAPGLNKTVPNENFAKGTKK